MKKLKNKLSKKVTGGCVDENGMEIPCPDTQFFNTGFTYNPLTGINEANPYYTNNPSAQIEQFNTIGKNNLDTKPNDYQKILQKSERTFGLNFNHILPSMIAKNLLSGISNMSVNSSQNAIKRFNNDQFSPLSYLPGNPNYSKQAYYGMDDAKKGGLLFSEGGFLDDFTNGFLNYNDEVKPPEESLNVKKVKKKKLMILVTKM